MPPARMSRGISQGEVRMASQVPNTGAARAVAFACGLAQMAAPQHCARDERDQEAAARQATPERTARSNPAAATAAATTTRASAVRTGARVNVRSGRGGIVLAATSRIVCHGVLRAWEGDASIPWLRGGGGPDRMWLATPGSTCRNAPAIDVV